MWRTSSICSDNGHNANSEMALVGHPSRIYKQVHYQCLIRISWSVTFYYLSEGLCSSNSPTWVIHIHIITPDIVKKKKKQGHLWHPGWHDAVSRTGNSWTAHQPSTGTPRGEWAILDQAICSVSGKQKWCPRIKVVFAKGVVCKVGAEITKRSASRHLNGYRDGCAGVWGFGSRGLVSWVYHQMVWWAPHQWWRSSLPMVQGTLP